MSVLSILVQMQTAQAVTAQSVLGQHTLNSQFHGVVGTLFHHDASLGFLQTADPAGYTVVGLLLQLVAGQNGLVGVDDDNEVTAVNVGGEINFVLATQQVGNGNGGAAQGLPAASTTYHLRATVSFFARVVDIMVSSNRLKYFDKLKKLR